MSATAPGGTVVEAEGDRAQSEPIVIEGGDSDERSNWCGL